MVHKTMTLSMFHDRVGYWQDTGNMIHIMSNYHISTVVLMTRSLILEKKKAVRIHTNSLHD